MEVKLADPRPFGFGELLDGAFTIYRRNFGNLFVAALLPQLPALLLWLVLPMLVGSLGGDLAAGGLALLMVPYTIVAGAFIWGAITRGAMAGYEGSRPSTGEIYHSAVEDFPRVLGAALIAGVLIAIGSFLFLVPGLILATMFFAVVPVAVVEGRGVGDCLKRSSALSRGGRWRILGVIIVTMIITYLPMIALTMVAGAAAGFALPSTDPQAALQSGMWLHALEQAAQLVAGALTTPFLVSTMALLYLDRRARTEAPDLEAAAAELGTSALPDV